MQNLDASGSSVDPTLDMERGNFQKSKWQADASKPSKSIATGPSADNTEGDASKLSKYPLRKGTQEPFAKPVSLNSQDYKGLLYQTNKKESRQNMTKIDIEKSARGDAPPEPKCPKKGRRVHRKSKNFGDIKMPSRPAEVNASALKPDQINRPIWFSLIASDEK